ncbi:hypothetical protein TrST_g9044 [Triparma strigata]|uniref:Coatomer gamma subunit appendage Ig-like subdomain domain-containing protein n=1 Tax=Triparma strigata TaxID=1606541 RepID=A0A9W6ZV86_9STRA|nr:hypothetical protein TrST_g9044 [Triparma strigata]
MSRISALELRAPEPPNVTSVSVYRHGDNRDTFTVAYTNSAGSNQTLQLRTYENPLQHNKSTNPFDNDSEEDDDYSASSNFDRDRTFSKSSQNSANSLVDSLEPLPPNARASVWASCVLSGSRQVTTVAVVPGDPKSANSRNQSNTSAAVSDKFVLHCDATKDMVSIAGEGRSNNLRILSKTSNSEFYAVASHPENGFCAYSGSKGVIELEHPSIVTASVSGVEFQSNVGVSADSQHESVGALSTIGFTGSIAVAAVGSKFYAYGGSGELTTPQPPTLLFSFPSPSNATSAPISTALDVTNVPKSKKKHQSKNAFKNASSVTFLSHHSSCLTVPLTLLEGGVNAGEPSKLVKLPAPVVGSCSYLSKQSGRSLVAVLLSSNTVTIRDSTCLSLSLTNIVLDPLSFFSIDLAMKSPPLLMATSRDGEARAVFPSNLDSVKEEAERVTKMAIDCFGRDGFPLAKFAEALSISYATASYQARETAEDSTQLLVEYLSCILGMTNTDDEDEGGGETDRRARHGNAVHALLCLASVVWEGGDASAKEKLCLLSAGGCKARRTGGAGGEEEMAENKVCTDIAHRLLTTQSKSSMFVEAAFHLFKAAQNHGLAVQTMEKLGGVWGKRKFGLFCMKYLSELWSSGNVDYCKLGMNSARGLLQSNPKIGLQVFTSQYDRSETAVDPSAHPISPLEVVAFLKTIVVEADEETLETSDEVSIPFHNGTALAATFLTSALGVDKPTTLTHAFGKNNPDLAANHDQLCFLLLEGLIGSTASDGNDSALSKSYRQSLHKFLSWPNALYNANNMREYFPATFKHEHALLLGKLGLHKEALEILYRDLQDMDLAVGYCDNLYRTQKERERLEGEGGGEGGGQQQEAEGGDEDDEFNVSMGSMDQGIVSLPLCPYLALIEVALEQHFNDPENAIKIISMRRDVVDIAAAIRALPEDTPVSSLADCLIPALRSSESRVRQLTVAANLARQHYAELQRKVTQASIRSQSNLSKVVAIKRLQVGPLIKSSPAEKLESVGGMNFPFSVNISKHLFGRYLIVQATIVNIGAVAASDISLTITECSDDCLSPIEHVSIKSLPPSSSSSSYAILNRVDRAVDSTVVLMAEMRYYRDTEKTFKAKGGFGDRVSEGEGFGGALPTVEEMQDIMVMVSDLSP